jgi:hypothetical protein
MPLIRRLAKTLQDYETAFCGRDNFSRPEKIGANSKSEKARIVLFWENNIWAMFSILKSGAKELIDADKSIISALVPKKMKLGFEKLMVLGLCLGAGHIFVRLLNLVL